MLRRGPVESTHRPPTMIPMRHVLMRSDSAATTSSHTAPKLKTTLPEKDQDSHEKHKKTQKGMNERRRDRSTLRDFSWLSWPCLFRVFGLSEEHFPATSQLHHAVPATVENRTPDRVE